MQELTITLPLRDFLISHLGISIHQPTGRIVEGQHVRAKNPIAPHLAEIIYAKCKNEHTCYIQFPTETSWYREPVIWAWDDWIKSEEIRHLQLNYAHQERVKRFIKEANVRIVAKAYYDEMDGAFDMEHCIRVALGWVTSNNKGAIFFFCKVKKLITKEEEL